MKRIQSYHILIGIVIVSVILRVAVALYLGNEVVELPGTFDQISYHQLALRVLGGHGFSFGEPWWPATRANEPTAHWSFLYTLYLTAVYTLAGPNPIVARIIQAIAVGILMPLLVYRLSVLLFSSKSPAADKEPDFHKGVLIGLLAASIMAVYIYFVYYAATLMTESFYVTGILWSFVISLQMVRSGNSGSWRQWLLLGLALGLTILLRQVFMLVVPFIFAWMWFVLRPKLYYFLAPLAVILFMILPWTIRNYYAFDHFVILNTNSGYALFWGNHPIHGTHFYSILPVELGTYDSLIPQELLSLNEAKMESALLKLGIKNVMDDPIRIFWLSLTRIPPYFEFWPSSDSGLVSNISRVGSFGLFLPFMLFGLIRTLFYRFPSWKTRLASPFTAVYLFMLVYTGIHVLTWTLIRYRLPIDAFLIIFAGLALLKIGEKLAAWRQRPLVAPVK